MDKEKLKKDIINIIDEGIMYGEDNYGIPTNKTIEKIAEKIIFTILQDRNREYAASFDILNDFVERLIQRITINNTDEGYLDECIDYACLIDDIKELAIEMQQGMKK